MPIDKSLALPARIAINTTHKAVLKPGEDMASSFKEISKLAEGLEQTVSALRSAAEGESAILGIELVGAALVAAATVVAYQLEAIKDERAQFKKEFKQGAYGFTIPADKDYRDLSVMQKAMKDFFDHSFMPEKKLINHFLGITKQVIDDNTHYFSVLPFYCAGLRLEEHVAMSNDLDLAQAAINSYFQSGLTDALNKVMQLFYAGTNVLIDVVGITAHKDDFLNKYRAPLFVITALSNLLWNLQCPIHPETGQPLTLEESIDLCREAEVYVGKLPDFFNAKYLFQVGLNDLNEKVLNHIRALRKGYYQALIHQCNFKDLNHSLRSILRTTVKNLFSSIYTSRDIESHHDIPNQTGADGMICSINDLNRMINADPDLIKPFLKHQDKTHSLNYLNKTPFTILDLIAIFSRLDDYFQRSGFLRQYPANCAFADELKSFHQKYIAPMRLLVLLSGERKGETAAKHILIFIAVLVKERGINLNRKVAEETSMLNAEKQIEYINSSVKEHEFYKLNLARLIQLPKAVVGILDEFMVEFYMLLDIAVLFDRAALLIEQERYFWLSEAFKDYSLNLVAEIQAQLEKVDDILERFNAACLDDAKGNNHNSTLLEMGEKIRQYIRSFIFSQEQFQKIVAKPGFSNLERVCLEDRLMKIAEDHQRIFGKSAGLDHLIQEVASSKAFLNALDPAPVKAVSVDLISSKQAYKLEELINKCANSMSFYSQWGHKGKLIKQLLASVCVHEPMSKEDLKEVLLNLFRICSSVSQTGFFQANYGKTRSAQVLIQLIREPAFHQVLPIADALECSEHEKEVFATLGEETILERLIGFSNAHRWEKEVELIEEFPALR